MNQFIETENNKGILIIRINRPAKKNAMSSAMRDEIYDQLQFAEKNEDIKVVMMTAIDPVFSAGVDLKDVVEGNAQAEGKLDPGAAFRQFSKPSICVVNGTCVTGGLEMALSCDMIVASDKAKFADTHAKLGLLPCFGMSALLPRAVGIRKAKELAATGNFLDASEALRIGLVNHIVEHDQLHHFALKLANDIATSHLGAVQAIFSTYDKAEGADFQTALKHEIEAFGSWKGDVKAANNHRGKK
jgi:enoyl-CoA hydratase